MVTVNPDITPKSIGYTIELHTKTIVIYYAYQKKNAPLLHTLHMSM